LNEVRIVHPLRGDPPSRPGDPLEPILEVDLVQPWFPLPALGRRIQTVTGQRPLGLAFETPGPRPVHALAAGSVEVRDSRLDDHGGISVRGSRAGGGYEAVVATRNLRISYLHLKRGSARAGPVRAGEVVGVSGNTGRCVDGSGRAFVEIEARSEGKLCDLSEFSLPIVVELRINGTPVGKPRPLPPGEVEFRGFRLERLIIDPERRPDLFRPGTENVLEVVLMRGPQRIARAETILKIT